MLDVLHCVWEVCVYSEAERKKRRVPYTRSTRRSCDQTFRFLAMVGKFDETETTRLVQPNVLDILLLCFAFDAKPQVDACETSEGLDPDEVRAYVADLVTRQMGAAAQQQQQQQAPLSPAPSAGAPGLAPAPSWPIPAPSGSGSGAGLASYPSSPPPASVLAGTAFQQQQQPLRSPGPGFGAPSSPGAASSAATAPTHFRLHPDQVGVGAGFVGPVVLGYR